MPYVFGTSTNYQTFADMVSRIAIGTSLHSIDAVNTAGTGYAVGNILTCSGGTSVIAATIEVLTVGGGGEILTARIRNAGLYTTAPSDPVAVTGGAGSGADFNLTFGTNGWLRRRANGCPSAAQSATVAAGGTGYTVNDTLTVSGGTFGHAATFRVVTAPGGVVGTVAVIDQGDYTTAPSNPASTTGGTGSGCTLNLTMGTGEVEIILEGEGSGSDEIFVGYRSFFDAGTAARNWCLNGFTGFDPLLSYDLQPGRSPGLDTAASGPDLGGAYVLLLNSTVTWWVSISPRRILGVGKTGTCYSSFHLGFLNPYATGNEWPYPLYIAGTTTERFRVPGTGVISSSGVGDPIRDSSSDVGPGLLRDPSGVWQSCFNGTDGSSRSASTQGLCVVPTGRLSGVTLQTGDDWYATSTIFFQSMAPNSGSPGTQTNRLIRTIQSGGDYVIRIPATIIASSGSTPIGVYGEIDGVYWFDTAGVIVPENRFTDGTQRFTTFQEGVRADNWALWAMRED